MQHLTEDLLDVAVLGKTIGSAEHGAVVSFQGTVRNRHLGRGVDALEYTAYGPMAEAICDDIVRETEARWPVQVLVAHRIGRLNIGDVSVVVVVVGQHRDEAFMACRHMIDEVKARVPIWKRECYSDGTQAWVDPTQVGGTPSTSLIPPRGSSNA